MNIVVCIKQVPDTAVVKLDPVTGALLRDGVPAITNPLDLHALEEAVLIRERLGEGNVKVTALSMGPPQAEAALRDAIASGADDAVLLSSRAFAGADTMATSYVLALAAAKIGAQLVLAGKQTVDSDTAQVGPGVACHLGWPQACYVTKIRDIAEGRAVVETLMDTGKEVLEISLPAVLTVVKEINVPRISSFKGKMKAKKAVIPVWTEESLAAEPARLGLAGSPTAVARTYAPPARGTGEIVAGLDAARAAQWAAGKIKTLLRG